MSYVSELQVTLMHFPCAPFNTARLLCFSWNLHGIGVGEALGCTDGCTLGLAGM